MKLASPGLFGSSVLIAISLSICSCSTAPARPDPAPTSEESARVGAPAPEPLKPFEARIDPARGCVNSLDRQTEADLALLKNNPGASRPSVSGMAVLSFPQTKKELDAWNRMAIAAVRIYSADQRELPLESVLLATDEQAPQIHRLPFIFPLSPVKEISPDSPWFGRMGPYVQTVYTLVPLRLLTGVKSELSVRLGGRMTPLTLLKLPIPQQALPKPLRGGSPEKLREDGRKLPEPAPILAALARDFCLGR